MARQYAAALTREQLEEMGIVSVTWDPEHQEYWIDRLWYKNKHGADSVKIHKRLKITTVRGKRKYTQGKAYPALSFFWNGKNRSFSLSKFVYAWFKGAVPEGYVVDHKDNNPFNNTLDNLQLLTKQANNIKRFVDNPECKCFNQFHNTEYDEDRPQLTYLEKTYPYEVAFMPGSLESCRLGEGALYAVNPDKYERASGKKTRLVNCCNIKLSRDGTRFKFWDEEEEAAWLYPDLPTYEEMVAEGLIDGDY